MLHLHCASRADALANGLGELLAAPLPDPFAPEIVAVPTRGIERWLTQRLSTRLGSRRCRSDGVCANVEFPFPRTLVDRLIAGATGSDPDADPWLAERLVWPLLETVNRHLDEPWLATLALHLGDGERRFAMVRHLAELYDRYGVRRPEMICGWARGEATDGEGAPLPSDGRWQAELWRRLRAAVRQPSPAERLGEICERIEAHPEGLALPERLSVFNLTRLPVSHLRVLRAVSRGREVHLFVLHPSPALWRRVAATAATRPVMRRAADPTAALASNRLLASWGHDARELQLVLAGAGEADDHHHVEPVAAASTLLTRLQAAVRDDLAPPRTPGERAPLSLEDRSVEVHACHGRGRQVEVIRDAILHLLEDDATLEPRDIIVMCPDVETVAPLIQATFGAGRVEEDPGEEDPRVKALRLPDLRVRLADRSLRQTNPILGVLAQVLELADGRVTASQLLDLADREPVRRRFRFGDDDLTRLREWVVASGIRWGLDSAHRAAYKLDAVAAGTWETGLARILLGVAMTEEDRPLLGGVLPLDDVESGAIDLAGRMAEFVERVRRIVAVCAQPQTIDGWAATLGLAADLLTASRDREAWQRAELARILDDVLAASSAGENGPCSAELGLGDVRALLADHLRGRPTRANFRTGHLTVCTLVPMRSVPHRVVCLLGLDDGEFPRKAPRDGDDLTLGDPHVGDRDPRSEDRQLLLDALMAATERLIITYTGNDERTNLARPPAVPVAELLDVVRRTVSSPVGDPAEAILVRHPLQPFQPSNFIPGELAGTSPWSFDRTALDGARALCRPRRPAAAFLEDPLPPSETRFVELDDVVRFVERPVRAFLRRRLAITVGGDDDDVEDSLPVELDPLAQWEVAQRLLDGALAGAALDDCVEAERARGGLPPGRLATPLIGRLRARVEQIVAEARRVGAGRAESIDVHLALADGRTLAGTVSGVVGETLRRVSYSRVNPRHRLAAWVRLLALTAARPDRPVRSVVIGRAARGIDHATLTVAEVAPLADVPAAREEAARDALATVLDLYDRGMREPLPLAGDASAAYAAARGEGRDPVAAARGAWESRYRQDREDRAPEHLRVHGKAIPFDDVLAAAPRIDEHGPGWETSEPTRFGRYARRLWDPLLAREHIAHR